MRNENFKKNLKVELIPKVADITEREARRSYEKFVMGQEEPFINFLNYLNQYMNQLKDKGVISPFLQFRARIKSPISAIKNDGRKSLDDIFGIEIICATDEEIEEAKKALEEIATKPDFQGKEEKTIKKDNGYEAIHCFYVLNDETIQQINQKAKEKNQQEYPKELFPAMEVQYKTIKVFYEANYGTARHDQYKGVNEEEIQKLYDMGQLVLGERLPYMWISDENSDKVRELSTNEVLKKMYPFLKLKTKEEIEK